MTTEGSILPSLPSGFDVYQQLVATAREWGPVSQARMDWLQNRGVSTDDIAKPWQIGETKVSFEGDCFDADPEGRPAVILGVIDGGRLVDLVAWDTETGWTGTWLGQGFALGQDQILNAATWFLDGSLIIHRSPLGWLRSGRRGIVILDPSQAWYRFRDAPRLLCEDEAHGEEIERLLEPPKAQVQILVPRRTAA